MRHLSHLATFSYVTNMHTKNLAIVWAPNLLRYDLCMMQRFSYNVKTDILLDTIFKTINIKNVLFVTNILFLF